MSATEVITELGNLPKAGPEEVCPFLVNGGAARLGGPRADAAGEWHRGPASWPRR